MTRLLYILRHAQSAGKQSGQRDYERNLTAEGEAKALSLGIKLKHLNNNIDLIISSGATRARHTAVSVNKTLQLPSEKIQFKTELYDALIPEWMGQIHKLPNEVHAVMLVGHNPWLSVLATNFHDAMVDLEPCELIVFKFDVASWEEIENSGEEILNIK